VNNDRTDERQIAQARNLTVGQVQRIRSTRGLTNEALSQVPDNVLRRALRRVEYPDLPRRREAFLKLQEENERGVIPANALLNALKQLDSMRTRKASPGGVAGVPSGQQVPPSALIRPTAGLDPGHTGWTSAGPGNIGGRTRSVLIHPQNPDTMWAGSAGGGIWRTDNGGASWEPVDDLMANLAVGSMAMDPTDPDIIFAGTGEGFSNLDAMRGAGLFGTVDGNTWYPLEATAKPEFYSVTRLSVSADGRILLVATPQGIHRSDDIGRLSWTRTLGVAAADVKFHPTDSEQAVAGGLASSSGDGQAYYTTDGGQIWNPASHEGAWSGRVELAYALGDPSIVYASVQMATGQIWRSTDGGRTYSRRDSALANGQPTDYLGEQGWYGNVIWAGHPTDTDFVIVGGVDLWKSTDGGDTLIDISTWWGPLSAHADHHFIVAHPGFDGNTNTAVFFGNDGGVFRTDDVETVGNDADLPRVNGWVELNNTYTVTQFYGGAGNADSGTIIGGAQDTGTLRYTTAGGTESWTEMFGGDGGYCAADPSDPDYFYGEYVYLNIHRSTDGGQTAEYISGQVWNGFDWVWKPPPYRIIDARNQDALFIAPFVLDPNEPNRILGGGLSLWRTNDAKTPNTINSGPSWRPIKGSAGSYISAIAVAQGNPDLVWVGHEDGQVYRTDNGTANNPVWKRIDETGPNPLAVSLVCRRIAIDHSDHETVYVTFSGYSRNNVWKTTDGGGRWIDIGASLPEAPVHSLTIHPRNSALLYVGTEVGIFASEDGGATWSPTNEGPTNCSVYELFWMEEMLVCATHGRGMFRIDLSGV
jgi:photosystem II stability/assembly factor-like uncharacterized protein